MGLCYCATNSRLTNSHELVNKKKKQKKELYLWIIYEKSSSTNEKAPLRDKTQRGASSCVYTDNSKYAEGMSRAQKEHKIIGIIVVNLEKLIEE